MTRRTKNRLGLALLVVSGLSIATTIVCGTIGVWAHGQDAGRWFGTAGLFGVLGVVLGCIGGMLADA